MQHTAPSATGAALELVALYVVAPRKPPKSRPGGELKVMTKAPLKPVGPAIEKRTVTPRRPRNAEVRTREDLTVAELERLGQRDAMMILVASRHGQRNELGERVVKWGQRN
jgi:hypothetical protein